MDVTVHHLSAELLLGNYVFHCVLPQHLFPPEARRQRGAQTWRFMQLNRGDLPGVSEGHHGDDLSWHHLLGSDQEEAADLMGPKRKKRKNRNTSNQKLNISTHSLRILCHFYGAPKGTRKNKRFFVRTT